MCVRVTVDICEGMGTYIHVYLCVDVSMQYVKKTRKEEAVHPSTISLENQLVNRGFE